jgi:hypothetical protein
VKRERFRAALVVLRWIVNVVSVVVIAGCVATLVWFVVADQVVERYTSGEPPSLFFNPFNDDLLAGDADVFVVGHNSGDSLAATRSALRHGADVVEIDVVPLNGDLYAGHLVPLQYIGPQTFRGPRVVDVIRAATEADAIALDLKDSAPWFIDKVIALLNSDVTRDQPFLVSTRDPATLVRLRDEAPDAIRILSIGDQQGLDVLQADASLQQTIDGVGVRYTLLDKDTMKWLRDRDLFIMAWTVNDVRRANTLIELGASAITTDNLAIMEALGGPTRREKDLRQVVRQEREKRQNANQTTSVGH